MARTKQNKTHKKLQRTITGFDEKKTAVTDAAAAQAVSPGLLFGVLRRGLPSVIEKMVYAFLPIGDYHSLFFTSHGMLAQTVKALRTMQTLRCSFSWDAVDVASGLVLASRFCTSLVRIEDTSNGGLEKRRPFQRCIVAMIKHCQSSLRRVTLNKNALATIYTELLKCPKLEALDLRSARMRPEEHKQINSEKLPKLQSLVIDAGKRQYSMPPRRYDYVDHLRILLDNKGSCVLVCFLV